MAPIVSVGLPVYNGERYLPNAFARLLEQDFEDFELIVCDNASTDATEEICQGFAQKDPRVRYFRNPTNIGLSANHNRTFELSSGRYFKWVSHDDDFPRAMLGGFVQAFEESPADVSVIYSRCEYVDEAGNIQAVDSDGVDKNDPRAHVRLAHLLRYIHMYNSPYGMIRSEMLRQTHLFGLFPMADHVLMAELAVMGVLVELPQPLLRIRRHPGRTFTANKTARAIHELFTPGKRTTISLLSLRARMELELVRRIAELPNTPQERILCTAVAAFEPKWRSFKAFGGKQKRKLLRIGSPGLHSS